MITITSTTLKNSYEAAAASMTACTATGNSESITVNSFSGNDGSFIAVDIPSAASGSSYTLCGVYGDFTGLDGDGRSVTLEKGKLNLIRVDGRAFKTSDGKAKFKLTAGSGVNISSQSIKIGFVNVIGTTSR